MWKIGSQCKVFTSCQWLWKVAQIKEKKNWVFGHAYSIGGQWIVGQIWIWIFQCQVPMSWMFQPIWIQDVHAKTLQNCSLEWEIPMWQVPKILHGSKILEGSSKVKTLGNLLPMSTLWQTVQYWSQFQITCQEMYFEINSTLTILWRIYPCQANNSTIGSWLRRLKSS